MKAFLDEDFLLQSEPAKRLYHDYAEEMPIFDYHCHLSPKQIADNRPYENLTRIWLEGDHYKWRAMRAAGIDEKYITGAASDREKFLAWAETVPKTLGNPLFHWTHLELKNSFGIDNMLLSPDTADKIYGKCREVLEGENLRPKQILKSFRVRTVYTTDDPADTLEYHAAIARDGEFDVTVLPAFRPDNVMRIESGEGFRGYIRKISEVSGAAVDTYRDLIAALDKRHRFFHDSGCRISDHALPAVHCTQFRGTEEAAAEKDAARVFRKALEGGRVKPWEAELFQSRLLLDLGRMNAKRGWTMQLHIGALRNVNSRKFELLGPDSGFDGMNDIPVAEPLARFLDALESTGELPKTIIYNINPRDNAAVAAAAGCFQDGLTPGKVQFGPAWWFNDTKDGMEDQLRCLSNIGLVSRFTGMVTDSRSFLSFSRHEYFRRILANLVGGWMARGEIPGDFELTGGMIRDICYNNAAAYFGSDKPAAGGNREPAAE